MSQVNYRKPKPARGFTLMELLVVVGLFAVVVTVTADIFLLTSRAQRKIFAQERAQADARFIMEVMSREIRIGTVNYKYPGYSTISTPEDELALIDSGNEYLRFHVTGDSSQCPDADSAPCMLVTVGTGARAATAPLSPKGLAVRSAKFYISPTADPLLFDPATGTYGSNQQPRVTIVMVLEAVSRDLAERSIFSLQTTSTTRLYRR